jgi:hypothetical protein
MSASASVLSYQKHWLRIKFMSRWALSVLDQVLGRLGDEYRAAGKTPLFDRTSASFEKSSLGHPRGGSANRPCHHFPKTLRGVSRLNFPAVTSVDGRKSQAHPH